jgi:SH3-like domain-containing protein
MLYVFPADTQAAAIRAHRRPYPDPIAVAAGAEVSLDPARTATTDIPGWAWCKAADGREGWVPEAWLDTQDGRLRLRRDFSTLELDLDPGEMVALLFSESGFVFCRKADGTEGWVPDAVLALVPPPG